MCALCTWGGKVIGTAVRGYVCAGASTAGGGRGLAGRLVPGGPGSPLSGPGCGLGPGAPARPRDGADLCSAPRRRSGAAGPGGGSGWWARRVPSLPGQRGHPRARRRGCSGRKDGGSCSRLL